MSGGALTTNVERRRSSVLLVDDDEDELEGKFSDMEGEFQALELPETELSPITVSMNSIVGLTNPKTLKLVGMIRGGEVVVMVDPSATHNFISLKAVEKLGVPVTGSGGFGVSLGNGEAEAVRGQECVKRCA